MSKSLSISHIKESRIVTVNCPGCETLFKVNIRSLPLRLRYGIKAGAYYVRAVYCTNCKDSFDIDIDYEKL